MTTCDAATKWLPFTISVSPRCTSAKVIVLGEREAISGAGLAPPHKGFRVSLRDFQARCESRVWTFPTSRLFHSSSRRRFAFHQGRTLGAVSAGGVHGSD